MGKIEHYSDEALKEIDKQYSELRFRYIKLLLKAFSFAERLRNDRAKEYMRHGVGRRLVKVLDNFIYDQEYE
jgi:hypothetical protein